MGRKLKIQSGGGEICPAGFFCLQEITLLVIMGLSIVIFVFYIFNQSTSRSSLDYYDDNEDNESLDGDIMISPSGKRVRISEDATDVGSSKNNTKKVHIVKEVHQYDHTPRHNSRGHYLADKAYERVVNPLLPPERDYEYTYGPVYRHTGMESTPYGVPINVHTRGHMGGYQQIGMLYKETISDDDKTPGNNSETAILPLYGRPTDTNRNKWNYYTSSDKFHSVKIPINYKNKDCNGDYGCEEISSDETVSVPAYNGEFKTTVYGYDSPKYIPYL